MMGMVPERVWFVTFGCLLLMFCLTKSGLHNRRFWNCLDRSVGSLLCPEIFVADVQGDETTSLFSWIATAYPKAIVVRSLSKRTDRELDFFDREETFAAGPYLLANSFRRRTSASDVAMDEAQNFIGCSKAPRRIRQTLNPIRVRFIVSLTDPALRAWTYYSTSMNFPQEKTSAIACQYAVHSGKFSHMVETIAPEIHDCLKGINHHEKYPTCAHDSGRWYNNTASEIDPASSCNDQPIQYWTVWTFTGGLYGDRKSVV